MRHSLFLLSAFLFLMTAGCGDGGTEPDSGLCYCDESCASERDCCDISDEECLGGTPLSPEDLLARALLAQAAYYLPSSTGERIYQTNWGIPAGYEFFGATPSQVESQLTLIFRQIQYEITQPNVKNLDIADKGYQAFITGMKKISGGEDYLVISIRGTQLSAKNWDGSLEQAIQDFGLLKAPVRSKEAPTSIPGSVVPEKIYEVYENHFQSVIQGAVEANPGRDVYVIGHSLGGPIAAYAAQHLVGNPNVKSVSLYTYNSFRSGNKAFADWMNKNLQENIRHITNFDPISTQPKKSEPWKPYHTGVSYVTTIRFGVHGEGSGRKTSVEPEGTRSYGTADPGDRTLEGLFLQAEGRGGRLLDAHRFLVFGADRATETPEKSDIPFLNQP